VRADVWEELERRGTRIAVVRFCGRAGEGGRIGEVILGCDDGDHFVAADRCTRRDELAYALEAPVWDRYGAFAGQPQIRGDVTWILMERSIVISGHRGREPFKEIVA
jgi:hypothetical protein